MTVDKKALEKRSVNKTLIKFAKISTAKLSSLCSRWPLKMMQNCWLKMLPTYSMRPLYHFCPTDCNICFMSDFPIHIYKMYNICPHWGANPVPLIQFASHIYICVCVCVCGCVGVGNHCS